MKKNIVAFGASNSKNSINKKFAVYAAHQLSNVNVNVLDLNDFEMPIYSIDRQIETGIPELAHVFLNSIRQSDGIVLSLAEHNGSYTAAFKNIFDWSSRVEKNVWMNKPMLLLATSDGAMGAQTVLKIAFNKFSRMSSNVLVDFSLPNFNTNFLEEGILNKELKLDFQSKLKEFESAISH